MAVQPIGARTLGEIPAPLWDLERPWQRRPAARPAAAGPQKEHKNLTREKVEQLGCTLGGETSKRIHCLSCPLERCRFERPLDEEEAEERRLIARHARLHPGAPKPRSTPKQKTKGTRA